MGRQVPIGNEVYRVVFVSKSGEKTYQGPYASKGAAKGQASVGDRFDWRNERYHEDVYVEVMTGEWERI